MAKIAKFPQTTGSKMPATKDFADFETDFDNFESLSTFIRSCVYQNLLSNYRKAKRTETNIT